LDKGRLFDVVVIGGGIIGCAAAYYLTRADGRLRVAVVERDPTYERASSALSMANVRVQFSLEENIRISQYALRVLARFDEEMAVGDERPAICHRPEGNLFLFDEGGRARAEANAERQRGLGCRVQILGPDEVAARYPLYKADSFAGATFGPDDGHIDAFAALTAYRRKAAAQGAVFFRDEVTGVLRGRGAVRGVRLGSGGSIACGAAVNCAGAWAARVAAGAGVRLPVEPVKRQVFVLDTAVKPDGPLPLTNLPSGLYFRTETGGSILLGKSMDADPVGFDFSLDANRFEELLWPELAGFVPAFDRLRLQRGWAGLYAVNRFDGNAILGLWPGLRGFYLANGFSGHGLQQAPAVGRYIAEQICGAEPSLDLRAFAPERILENRPLLEDGLV